MITVIITVCVYSAIVTVFFFVLVGHNISIEKRFKVMQSMNDFLLGRNHFDSGQDLLDYIKFYFPKNNLIIKEYPFRIEFIVNGRSEAFLSLEDLYKIQKKDKFSISKLANIIQCIYGLDDRDKFIAYIENFNNWFSIDWQLFVAEKRWN